MTQMCQIGKIPEDLQKFFKENPHIAIAFSGGVDSTYLLYAAIKSGAETVAYTIRTAFQTSEECQTAENIAKMLGAKQVFIDIDILENREITGNPPDRCYLCKKTLFTAIKMRSVADGFDVILDGTNASDDASDRPGMRALKEFGVLSPLRMSGITKKQVRILSKSAKLPNWHMPSNSCLATRIPYFNVITKELLDTIKTCEEDISKMGFTDFRVRSDGKTATLETINEDRQLLENNKVAIETLLLKYHSTVSYAERMPHQ